MIVLDASLLIAQLDARDGHHDRAVQLLLAEAGESLGASEITLAETLVAPARAGRLDDATAALERLKITPLALGESASERLAQLRVETACKLPDCCVLLAAKERDAALASFDSALIEAAAGLGLRTLA